MKLNNNTLGEVISEGSIRCKVLRQLASMLVIGCTVIILDTINAPRSELRKNCIGSTWVNFDFLSKSLFVLGAVVLRIERLDS